LEPVYHVLEPSGIKVWIVNARHVKYVPGHKTDKKDSAWLCKLLLAGLLKPSYIPPKEQRELRDLTRYRKKLVQDIASNKNRIIRILEDCNVKLSSVLSDTSGVTATKLIDKLCEGKVVTMEDIDAVYHKKIEASKEELWEACNGIVEVLKGLAYEWKNIPMLAHTHGQPASPTLLGKEIMVFATRLEQQLKLVNEIPFSGKFGGATGNFNAHVAAYPEINWAKFADQFLEKSLGLKRQQPTTQIEHYDNLAAFFDGLKRINNILIDLARDMWSYISMDYFKQKIKKGEVGSSAMPHKINPIDFENAEGNLGMANAIFEHLSAKLPISRLQRDLTDSTVSRNIGVPLAHSLISWRSLVKGLDKLIVNTEKINDDLDQNWEVIAEAIQTILRRENYPKPYEALKEFTRKNKKIHKEEIHQFIDSLNISGKLKDELKMLSPFTFTGINPF
jgi:adenylosuccinate lyase